MSLDHASEQVQRLSRIVFRPWEPQIISTFVRFEMADRLAKGRRTVGDLAERTRRAQRLTRPVPAFLRRPGTARNR